MVYMLTGNSVIDSLLFVKIKILSLCSVGYLQHQVNFTLSTYLSRSCKYKITIILSIVVTLGNHYMSSQAVVGRSRHEFVHQGQTVYQWDQSLGYVLLGSL